MNKLTRKEVYNAIDGERDYQDKKWNYDTTPSEGKHSVAEWMVYIQDYLTEGMHLVSRNADPEAIRLGTDSIRKIGAMCVACMEQNGVDLR